MTIATRHGLIIDRKKQRQRKVWLFLALFGVVSLMLYVYQKSSYPKPTMESRVDTLCDDQTICVTVTFIPRGTHLLDNSEWISVNADYWLTTHEVTQLQWDVVMGTNPSYFSRCGQQCPVENVSAKDALLFIDRLNDLLGGQKFRLPTESEWIYAATSHAKPDLYVKSEHGWKINSLYGWLSDREELRTHPVGQLESTGYHLYDLMGNVREWVLHDCALHRPWWKVILQTEDCGQRYITLGGSFIDSPGFARPEVRYHEPTEKAYDVGFRLALSAQ